MESDDFANIVGLFLLSLDRGVISNLTDRTNRMCIEPLELHMFYKWLKVASNCATREETSSKFIVQVLSLKIINF
jgi:hypothetical protein